VSEPRGATDATDSPRHDRGGVTATDPARPAASAQFEFALIVLASLLVAGIYLILWASSRGELGNESFTVWHIPGYVALIGLVLLVVLTVDRAMRSRRRWRSAMPDGYDSVVLGVALLAIYPLVDLVWTTSIAGTEDITGVLGVTRLFLPAGLILILSGPIRAARRRHVAGATHHGLRVLPAVLASGLLLAALTIPVVGLSPMADVPAGERPAIPAETASLASGLRSTTVDGRRQARLTSGSEQAEAVWSPDGERIAFADSGEISVMRADGSDQRLLASNTQREGWISWAPDSTRIAYMSTLPAVDSAAPAPVAAPVPKPVQGAVVIQGEDWDIFVRAIDGGEATRLTDAEGTDGGPSWSPDGTRIAFHSERTGDFDLWLMEADGSGLIQLTTDSSEDFGPTWSPDGTRIAWTSDRSGDYEIWSMAADGSDLRKLTESEGNDYSPSFSPDGSTLAFLSDRSGRDEIHTLTLVSGVVAQVTDDARLVTSLAQEPWSPDGTTLVYAGRLLTPEETAAVNDAYDVARLLLTVATLAAVLLGAWRAVSWAPGIALAVFGISAMLLAVVYDELRFVPALLLAGLAAEVAVRLLRPDRGSRGRIRAIAAFAPAAWTVGWVATLLVAGALRWSVDLTVALVMCSAGIGVLLAQFLFVSEAAGSTVGGVERAPGESR
jgi:Tol biopolymer transport system component